MKSSPVTKVNHSVCLLAGLMLTVLLEGAGVSQTAADTWTYKADMPTARTWAGGCVLDGKIYVIGGATSQSSVTSAVEVYDPIVDTWTKLANMPSARCFHAACTFDGKIYVFGGVSPGVFSTAKKNVYVYDPQIDTWTQKADMPNANASRGIAVVDGTIYLIGGLPIGLTMAYNPITESWTQKADMPTARGNLSACVVDGKIYAIGGATEDWREFSYKHVEVYDPSTNTWTRKSDMPTERWSLGTCVVDGKIYAIGGNSALSAVRAANEVYDPITDTWTTKSPLQQKRLGHLLASIGDKIYAIGGHYYPNLSMVTKTEEYDTGLSVPTPDFNGDGIVDSADMCMMIDHWGTDESLYDIAPPPFGDGIVDIQDLNLLSEYLLEEIMLPVANAGLSRYAAREPVTLDGTGSYDPDDSGTLSYAWRQISGPSVVITDANVATPAISGFVQTDEIQECEFELVVSDGELTSLPDSVKIIIVPNFGSSTLRLENASFDANKPTIIYFGGGDCINGYSGQPWSGGTAWMNRANVIGFPNGYTPDSGSTEQTYYKYGDMIIAYLSSVAPDYKQLIQTMGWSTGGMPAIDIGIHLNRVYWDPRYAVNQVTHLDVNPACRDTYLSMVVYLDSVELFLTSSVDGEQCWLDHYYGTAAYAYEPMSRGNFLWVRTGLDHNQVRDWYRNSPTDSDKNNFNGGVVGGAYWSVIGPGKNLQLAPESGVYYFLWNGNQQTGAMNFFNESEYPGRLPEPVTLVVLDSPLLAEDDPNGVVLTCAVSENAVGYQLLSGSNPYNVADYNIVADGNSPPEVTVAMLPPSDTWWTVKVRDAHGSTIYADPICVGLPFGVIAYWKLDEVEGSVAEDMTGDNHGVLHGELQWQPAGGMKAGALQLDGIDDYMSTDFVSNPANRPFSVFTWIKGNAPGQVIISQTDSAGEIWLGTEPVSGKLMTGLVAPPAGRNVPPPLVSESVITDGQWHHVGFVWNGAYRSLYVDGVEVAKDTAAQNPLTSAIGGLYIGAGKNLRAGTFFSGLIDDVRTYNVALTADQIGGLAR